MKENKWSADNVSFGSGGGLLQKVHKDTQKCAFNCSYAVINGTGVKVLELHYMHIPTTNPPKRTHVCTRE